MNLFGMAIGMPSKVEWPVMKVDEREKEKVQKKVYEVIEGMVFGTMLG